MLEKVKESLRDCKVTRIGNYEYFVHPLSDGIPFIDPDMMNEVTDAIVSLCDFDRCDYIVTTETMGIPISSAVSIRLGIPYNIIRKRRYGLPGEVEIVQHTGYSSNRLYINGPKRGDRIVIVDDVLSTGGTMMAIMKVLKNVIGCEILDAAVIFGKGDADSRISDEFGIRIRKLIDVEIDGDSVRVRH